MGDCNNVFAFRVYNVNLPSQIHNIATGFISTNKRKMFPIW